MRVSRRKKKYKIFTPDGHGVVIYRKGKHRLFVDDVIGRIILVNPSPFKGRFFSKEGQKERLRNVGRVLKIAANPFRTERLTANVRSKALKRGLEAVANNPYTTAAIAAGGITAARGAARLTTTPLKSAARAIGKKTAKAADFALDYLPEEEEEEEEIEDLELEEEEEEEWD